MIKLHHQSHGVVLCGNVIVVDEEKKVYLGLVPSIFTQFIVSRPLAFGGLPYKASYQIWLFYRTFRHAKLIVIITSMF